MKGIIFAVVSAVLLARPPDCAAQTRDDVMNLVRNNVVSLRVFGERPQFVDTPQIPIWGTGFVVPSVGDASGRLRILTAKHVVDEDAKWVRRGNGVARTVYPLVMGQGGAVQVEGFRGVTIDSGADIAQVVGPRNMSALKIDTSPLTAGQRYFVASWGLDDNSSPPTPTEEPYIKEVKYVDATNALPAVPPGLVLLESLPGQPNNEFRHSESGSPVVDINGAAVAVVVEERRDLTTNRAFQGLALPLASVSDWLVGVQQRPVMEPNPIRLDASIAIYPDKADINLTESLAGACVFVGKYSARNVEPNSERAKQDAPFGIEFLSSVIREFQAANPESVTDEEDSISKDLAAPRTATIFARDGAVYIRSQCPNVVPKPKRTNVSQRIAYYGPVIATATAAYKIQIRQFLRQAYLGDFFYWGVVNSIER